MTTTNKTGGQDAFQDLLRHCTPEEQRAVKPVLQQLHALGTGQPIPPSPEIAALLGVQRLGQRQPAPLHGPRRRSKRTAITILAVSVSLGAGSTAAAAAADDGFRTNLGNSIGAIISTITGGHLNPAGHPNNGHGPERKPQHPVAPVPGPGNHGGGRDKTPATPGSRTEPAPKATNPGRNDGPPGGPVPSRRPTGR